MTIQFKLETGMKDDQLYKELEGSVSGESLQEVQQILKPNHDHIKEENPYPLHEVIMSDGEYAIIKKTWARKDIFNQLVITNEYFWSGINDEGKYFIHPLEGFWIQNDHKIKIDDVVSWACRHDEGFCTRIQGDILLQFLSKGDAEQDMEGYLNKINIGNDTGSRTVYLSLEKDKQQQPRNQISLGNHKISTDGVICSGLDYIVLQGKTMMLQHPQHGLIEKDIPKDHIAVIASQRGRYLGSNFD